MDRREAMWKSGLIILSIFNIVATQDGCKNVPREECEHCEMVAGWIEVPMWREIARDVCEGNRCHTVYENKTESRFEETYEEKCEIKDGCKEEPREECGHECKTIPEEECFMVEKVRKCETRYSSKCETVCKLVFDYFGPNC